MMDCARLHESFPFRLLLLLLMAWVSLFRSSAVGKWGLLLNEVPSHVPAPTDQHDGNTGANTSAFNITDSIQRNITRHEGNYDQEFPEVKIRGNASH